MSELQKCAYSGKSLRYLRGKSTQYCVVLGKKPSKTLGSGMLWWDDGFSRRGGEAGSPAYSAESGEDGEFTSAFMENNPKIHTS
jgi:hypothetical protein